MIDLHKIKKEIRNNYSLKRKEAEEVLRNIENEEEKEYFNVLKGIFTIGFEFTAGNDGSGGGAIEFTVVATTDKGMVVSNNDGNEYFFLWRELASRLDWYYAEGEE